MGTVVVSHDTRNTVLGLVQDFCRKAGLPRPNSLLGSQSASVLQLVSLLEEVGEFCISEVVWPNCLRTPSFSGTGVESLGNVYTLFPDAFDSFQPKTFWNRTENEPIKGPASPEEVSRMRAIPASVTYVYYFESGELKTWPAVPAGHQLEVTYRSRHWLAAQNHQTRSSILEDTDAPVIPCELLRLGLLFYWRRAKELPYRVEEERFLDKLSSYGSRAGHAPVLQMDCMDGGARPGIVVPVGNWSL